MNINLAIGDLAPEDLLRADLYDFLARLLVRPPDRALLARIACLSAGEGELCDAMTSLATLARTIGERDVEREFNRLFIGLGRGELVPYASYYLTGFLNEKPLAALRQELRELGIEREASVKEPEDNIATLCEVMGGLIRGRFHGPAPLGQQRRFFERQLECWAGHFFRDLEAADGAFFYAPVGRIGRIFMGIERGAFRLAGKGE